MEQNSLDIVRRGYEAFGRGDIDGLLALLDENIQWTTPGPPELPIAGRRTGKQAVAAFFQDLAGLLDVQTFEPKEFIAQGDRVVVLGRDTARVKATGKVIESAWVHAFSVRDGKIARLDEYNDVSALVAELKTAQSRL
jgi:uncharacterized protein